MAAQQPTAQPDATQQAPAPAGLKAKLPLIALVAVGLAVGGGTGAAVVGPIIAKKMGRAAPTADAAPAAEPAAGEHGEDAAAEAEDTTSSAAPSVTLLENLVLNPAGSGGSRFLLLSVAIESAKDAGGADFTARDAELRDIILTALGSKTVDQLTDISGRDVIKTELQIAITARFGKGAVKRLYFPQFVVQ